MKEDYLSAETYFKESVKIWPNSSIGNYWCTRTLVQLKKYDEAKKYAIRAIEIDPKDEQHHYVLGLVLLGLYDCDGAINAFENAIDLNRKYLKAHLKLPFALLLKSSKLEIKEDESIHLSERVLKAIDEAFLVFNERNEIDKKLFASDLMNLRELQVLTWNQLAYGYVERDENFVLAKEYIEKALNEDPENPHYLDTKAWTLIKSSEKTKSIPESERIKNYRNAKSL